MTFNIAEEDSMSLDNSSINSTQASFASLDLEFYNHHTPIGLFDKYFTPVWYLVGFPGNIIAFLIWFQPRMRPSSGCYLAALALADFIFLALHMLYELQWIWDIRTFHYPVICTIYPILFYMGQYLSPLLVLAFTVERYISVCHPFLSQKYCTTSRAIKVIAGMILLTFCLHAVQGYFWWYDPKTQLCDIRQEVLQNGEKSVWAIWGWITELLVFGLAPVATLILNIFVISEARRMSRSEEARLMRRKGHTSAAATITLLAVSFYLIFTTLPVTVLYCMASTFPYGDITMSENEIKVDQTWRRHFVFYTVRKIVEEVCMSHYACNFIIYFTTGKLFRRELKIQCYRVFCKERITNLRRKEFIESTRTEILLRNGNVKNGTGTRIA